jgi:hypothetical protein
VRPDRQVLFALLDRDVIVLQQLALSPHMLSPGWHWKLHASAPDRLISSSAMAIYPSLGDLGLLGGLEAALSDDTSR